MVEIDKKKKVSLARKIAIKTIKERENVIEFKGMQPGQSFVLPSDRLIFDSWYQDGNLFLIIGNKPPED